MSVTMRAVLCDHQGTLTVATRPIPSFPDESPRSLARVRVQAFGVNRADLLQRAGHYPPPPGVSTEILGLEFSGTIEEVSQSEVTTSHLRAGDEVMGICAGGAYAEYVIVPLEQLLPKPSPFSITEAAAFPEAYLTAFDALINQGRLSSGERVLIHAIGSGVGVAAAHLAALLGAEVVGTTRSEWKRDRALTTLPVHDVWLSHEGHWVQDTSPFDLIIDFIGAAYLKDNLKVLASQGRLVVVGLLGGARAELNLGLLLAKRARLIGTVLRSRSAQEKIELTQKFRRELLGEFENSSLLPPEITQIFPAHQIEEAHERLAGNDTWSKLVCTWDI